MSSNNSDMSGSTANGNNIRFTASTFTPMTPGPQNPGFNPRYLPPQKRTVTNFGDMERPQSAMSNDSFVSQTPVEGGVSLNSLSHGQQPLGTASGPGTYGHGRTGVYSQGYGQGAMMGVGAQGFQSGYGATNGMSGYGAMGSFGRPGGYGAAGAGPPGQYSFGNLQLPAKQAPSSFLKPTTQGGMPNFGAIGTAVPSSHGYFPNNATSPDSANDSVQGGGDRQAYNLADLIRSGLADPGDDDSNDPLTGRNRHRQKPSHTTASAVLMHRPRRSTANTELDPSYKSALVAARKCNVKGNAAAFIAVETAPLPNFFAGLPHGINPSLHDFYFTMPVMEPCRSAVASNAGVVRIRNIPYSTPRSEITAFVGRNAQIVSQPEGSPYFAVHVIMERHTGKTMDAFIEFTKHGEAQYVVAQFNKRMMNGRHPRIGDRHVEVELSTQEDLMTEMFPRAKNVVWEGATPRILANNEMYYEGVPSSGFTGFLSNEEVVMVVKHAETPHRSPFAQRAIIRVFESHVSTLHKYPWFAHEAINMTERRLLFDCTMSLGKSLIIHLRKFQGQHIDNTKPTAATLQELTVATLVCPGFSEQQKANYIDQLVSGGFGAMASSRGMNLKFGGISNLSPYWPFQVLARTPGAQDDLVMYFAALMREATMGGQTLSLAEQHALRASGANSQGPFGNITFDYGNAKTLSEVGQVELRTIETLLSRVLKA